jgi:hypothetical protein
MLFNDTEWVEAEARRLGVLAQASRSKSAMKKQTTEADRGWSAGSQFPPAVGRSGGAGAQHHHLESGKMGLRQPATDVADNIADRIKPLQRLVGKLGFEHFFKAQGQPYPTEQPQPQVIGEP